MRKTGIMSLSIVLTFIFCFNANAQESISYNNYSAFEWLFIAPTPLNTPLINDGADISGKSFDHADIFNMTELPGDNFRPSEGRTFDAMSPNYVWMKTTNTKSGYFNLNFKDNGIDEVSYSFTMLSTYLEVNKYQEIELTAHSNSPFQVFIDGEMVLSNDEYVENTESNTQSKKINVFIDGEMIYSNESTADENNNEVVKSKKIKVEMGKHTIYVKSLFRKKGDNKWLFKLEAGTKYKESIKWTLDPTTRMNMDIIQNGIRLENAIVSPTGKYVKYSFKNTTKPSGKTEYWSEIYNISENKMVFSTKYNKLGSLKWHPTEDAILFVNENNGKKYIFKQDLTTNKIVTLMAAPENMSFYDVNNDNTFIIYGINVTGKKNPDGVNRLDGMEDRWPWYRNQTNIYKYDIRNNKHRQLTAGKQKCDFIEIHPTEDKILVSQSVRNYSQRPYTRQIMMELDFRNGVIDTLWNENFGGSAQYSPDGSKLLVTGSAMMFNGVGINLPVTDPVNDYDNQAFIFNIADKSVKPITRNFNPNIESADWCRNDGMIYFKVEEKTYHNIYSYNVESGTFTKIDTGIDNVYGMTKSQGSNLLSYYGCSIQDPEQGFVIDVTNGSTVSNNYPEEDVFNDVQFGEVIDYTFVAKDGDTIDGYYYLPVDFDSTQKYPMIVYYYGGTSPVDRSFRGRYPKNYYAANGYVVYVLNPAGTTGYGQKYASEHVNNWGITVADEIIDGVTIFTAQHPFVDAKHIGCMGASYGGFMTELLTTRTDIFAAAISHAGISSIASYWGEGYWGYLYNSVAAAETFPWDNREMYVGQSALFNADKIDTPLLLLHGTDDTNVPVGESIQLYTALKLLGKECEFIEIQGQDHHIKDYNKFNKWQKTIMAWWDKWLKGDDSWWNDLY